MSRSIKCLLSIKRPPFEPLKLKKMPQCLLDQLLFSHLDPTRGQFNNAKQIDHPPQTVNVSGQSRLG